MAQFGTCRGCKQRIRWVRLESGKMHPLDPTPDHDKGTVRVPPVGSSVRPYVVSGSELDVLRSQGESLYVSHFATCPEAEKFRKGPK